MPDANATVVIDDDPDFEHRLGVCCDRSALMFDFSPFPTFSSPIRRMAPSA